MAVPLPRTVSRAAPAMRASRVAKVYHASPPATAFRRRGRTMATQASETTLEGHLEGLNRIHRGKVRDIFAVDEHHLLLVATDRVSAFDVILPQRIPDKGRVLTSLSAFWFRETGRYVHNHMVETDVKKMPEAVARHARLLAGRSMLVNKATPLKAEFVVRGYLAGSGWIEYQKTGAICGHKLPAGLKEAD